jgi:hypothetical protein
MSRHPVPRWKQQLGGAAIFALGAAGTIWLHAQAEEQDYYLLKPALILPAVAVVGLAIIMIPGYREERLARGEDISALTGIALITARWWGVLVLALLASAANFWWMQTD